MNRDDVLQEIETAKKEKRPIFLRAASLHGMDLSGLNLEGALLVQVDLRACNLENTSLARAQILTSHLDNANCHKADFTEAVIANSSLHHLRARQASFRGVQCWDSCWDYSDFQGAIFRESTFHDCMMNSSNLDYSCWEQAKLRSHTFIHSTLKYVHMEEIQINKGNFRQSNLDEISLQGSMVNGGCFDRTILTWSNFRQSTLEWCTFSGAEMREVNLKETSMYQCRFDTSMMRCCLDKLQWEARYSFSATILQMNVIFCDKETAEQLGISAAFLSSEPWSASESEIHALPVEEDIALSLHIPYLPAQQESFIGHLSWEEELLEILEKETQRLNEIGEEKRYER